MVGIVPEADKGSSTALFTAAFNAGMLCFSAGFGKLIDIFETFLVAFNGTAAMLAAALVIVLFLSRRSYAK